MRKEFFVPDYVGGQYLTEDQTGVGSRLNKPVANLVVMRVVYHGVNRRQLKEGRLGDGGAQERRGRGR